MSARPRTWPLRHIGRSIFFTFFLVASRVCSGASTVQAADSFDAFTRYTLVVSAEGGFNHFGGRLGSTFVQTWDLAASFSILPFDPFQMNFLDGALDGALQAGLEPVFQRFQTTGQNFGGMGLALRYYLIHWRVGRFVPYVNVSVAPGGTDLRIPQLRGPFMFLIRAGAGVSYFATEHLAFYAGYQVEHVSNAYTYGTDYGLESPGGATFGVAYFFH